MTVIIASNDLGKVSDFFRDLPEIAERAMVVSINEVSSRSGLALLRREMREQIEFPAGYLEQGRLKVTRKAKTGSLEAVIRGRDRATSLARFAAGQNPENTRKRPIQVQVSKGKTRWLRKAFLVRLKNNNIGLAVRLKPGETLKYTSNAYPLDGSAWLLYGPSVDQVFRGVADERTADIASLVERSFYRQFARLARG